MGDLPHGTPGHRRLGGPLPRQLPNAPRAHPQPPEFSRKRHAPLPRHRGSVPVSRSCPRVAGRLHTCDSPVRRSPPARCRAALPLDLHVLGLSLAFILSQDQTLHCMCLFCYFHCPRQGFLASRKKKTCRTPVAACLSSSHPCQRTSLPPRPAPPRPRTVPGPKAGAKISQFFIPIQTFLQLFCEKIRPKNSTDWKTTGNRNVFSPAGHVHPGDVLRIPTTKRPHRHARQGRAPRHVGKPGHGTHGLKITGEQPRESPWFPLRNPPTTGKGATRLARTRTRRVPCVFMARSAHVFVPPSRHSRITAVQSSGFVAAVTQRRGELMPLPHPKRAITTPCTRRVRRQAMPTKEVLPICRYLKLSIGEIPFY